MRLLIFLLITQLLTGCAVGGGEFSCKGYPEHTTCMDVEQVYQATSGTVKRTTDLEKHNEGQSKKIRIWLAPWQTPEGNQVSASYVDTDLFAQHHSSLSTIEALDNQYFNPIGGQ